MNYTLEGTGEGMINQVMNCGGILNTRDRSASGTKINQSFTAAKNEPVIAQRRH